MSNQNTSNFENSEKHQVILATLEEFGIWKGFLPYREALEKYYNWLNQGIKPIPEKLFGEYSFRVTNYELLTARETEILRALWKSYKPKKLFSGVSMYSKMFATSEYTKKEKALYLKPGECLWEVSGIDVNTVKQMAKHASETVGIEIVVCDRNGAAITQ